MKVPLLDLIAQHVTIRDEVQAAVQSVIDRQQFIMGPEVAELERRVAAYQHVPHAVGCASGTDALLLPLRTLDLKPGDEVIAPAFTFFATAGAIHNTGGTPVFVDIDPVTFNIDPAAIEAAITSRTRAIVVVHLFGQMAPMERIMPIARKHGLMVIEDGAQAIGARRKVDGEWRLLGELGTVGTLSFFPSKNLGGWGDGGMMLTNDAALADRLSKLRLQRVEAAVLLVKFGHLDRWNAGRRARAARYDALFAANPAVCAPKVDPANEHIYHQYTIRVARRDKLLTHLKARDIGCAIYYPVPLHLQECFAHLGYRQGSLPVTEAAMGDVLSLPIYPELTDAQQDAVVQGIAEFSA